MPAASASEAQLLTPWLRWAPHYSPARGTTFAAHVPVADHARRPAVLPPVGGHRVFLLWPQAPVHAPHVCPPVRPGRVVAVPDDDLVPSHFCRDLVEDPVELPLPAPGAGAGDDDNTRVSH